ncbi:50S ribosomal protein L5 [Salmonella enterica subsp. arizonae]|nr:50S ribosomal protein L5 [Salmonella enterica subsp. arizonae]
MAKLHDYYKDEVVKKLMTEFNYNSVMQVPRVEKITLNMGVGEAIADKKLLDNAAADLTAISGQKPLITKARKSVAGFKIRQGYPIGCKVTLRGERMWEFFERLITIAVRVSVTSVACPLSHSTVVVTTAWVSVSRSSSQKSTTIKSTAFVVWILPLPLLRNLTKKAVLCWLPLTSRSASKVGLLNG